LKFSKNPLKKGVRKRWRGAPTIFGFLETSQHHELIAVAVDAIDPGAFDIGKLLPNRRNMDIDGPGREGLPGSPNEFDQIAPINDVGSSFIELAENLPFERCEFDVVTIIRQRPGIRITFDDGTISSSNVNFWHFSSSYFEPMFGLCKPLTRLYFLAKIVKSKHKVNFAVSGFMTLSA
jgi:hypothetical protein